MTERHGNAPSTSREDNALFVDILEEAPLLGHRKSRSVFGAVLYCVLLAMLLWLQPVLMCFPGRMIPSFRCFAVAMLVYYYSQAKKVDPLMFTNVVILLVSGIFQQYFVSQVQKIRLQGYYSFSQKLKHIVRLPFAITAYGTAAMLLVMVWKPHIGVLPISTLLRIIMLAEAICCVSFMSIYIGYLHQYNSINSEPDILKSLYSPLQQSSPLEGLRYHDGGRLSDQQMALLQYQRENLHFLSEEILRLQECLSKYERTSDGNTPQVDLAHLLAAREQELRTVSAEMNQLQSDLRLTRSLIAERDAEVQRVRTTNNQYMEENERLRAILGEWSARAAKLERALEVERMSNLELQKKLTASRSPSSLAAESSGQQGA